MCEGWFPGRIALYWAPSWILLLPFCPIESCSNWQSFTIGQHWRRFWDSPFFSALVFSPKDWFWNYSFSAQCVYGLVYLCVHSFACVHTQIHKQRHKHRERERERDMHTCTCTCLNACLGNCLNRITGDYGPCCGKGLWELGKKHTLHSWHQPLRCCLISSKRHMLWLVISQIHLWALNILHTLPGTQLNFTKQNTTIIKNVFREHLQLITFGWCLCI